MPAELSGPDAPLPARVLEQAADWLLRLHDDASPAAHDACAQWCAQHPDHARAWQRAQHLQTLVAQLPSAWALPVLGRAQAPRRRAAVKRIGLWLALLPAGWAAWQLSTTPPAGQQLRTAVGERRRRVLADGSILQLDTDSRVRLLFDPRQRRLQLERGRIRVETATDPQSPARPFEVITAHGRVRALGTGFDVRLDAARTRLALFEGGLDIHAAAAPAWRLQAGQQAWFDASGRHAIAPLDDSTASWTGGMLVADARPLGEVVAELARYRRGVLRCDPQVAALAVSGAYPLDDSERSLALLEATYPLRVRRSAGGWWVLVEPR